MMVDKFPESPTAPQPPRFPTTGNPFPFVLLLSIVAVLCLVMFYVWTMRKTMSPQTPAEKGAPRAQPQIVEQESTFTETMEQIKDDTRASELDATRGETPEAQKKLKQFCKAMAKHTMDDVEAESGYLYLLDYVRHLDSQKLQEKAVRVSADDLIREPEKYRGKAVMIARQAAQVSPFRLETPSGNRNIHRLRLTEPNSPYTPGVQCDFTEPLPIPLKTAETEGRWADAVEVTGIFYKVACYVTQRDTIATVPIIISRTVSLVDVDKEPREFGAVGVSLMGIALVAFIGCAILTLRPFLMKKPPSLPPRHLGSLKLRDLPPSPTSESKKEL